MPTVEQKRIFCENVAYLRKKHGLSRAQMAKRLGIADETLKRIEGGAVTIRTGALLTPRIFEQFGIYPAMQFMPFCGESEDI